MAEIKFYSDYPNTDVPDDSETANKNILAILKILGLDVDTYDTGKNYGVDDFVVYQKELWRCTNETTGTWNEEDWIKDSVIVPSEMSSLTFNKDLIPGWKTIDVNIPPNNEVIIDEIIGASEMWVYFSGAWYQRKMMYFDSELTTQGVLFDTSDANPSAPQKYGASVSLATGLVRNDTASTTNITKLKYR